MEKNILQEYLYQKQIHAHDRCRKNIQRTFSSPKKHVTRRKIIMCTHMSSREKNFPVHERVKNILKPIPNHPPSSWNVKWSNPYVHIAVHYVRFDCRGLVLRVEFSFPTGRGAGSIFASLTCYQSVPSSSKYSPSTSISGLTMRNIFIALCCCRFCCLNCDGCSDFSLCIRHFVKNVAEELFTSTVYKSLEKRFLRKIMKWVENIQKGNVKHFDKSRPKKLFQRQIKKTFLNENLSSLAFQTAFGPNNLRTF